MKLSLDELRYVLLPGENPGSAHFGTYQEIFRCWRSVWSQTFQELEGDGRVFSDDFSRQSTVGAILHGDRCAAIGLFHHVDFRLDTSRADSYFKVWPESAVQRLLEDGPRIVVGSNITVDPEYRGDLGNGLQMKNLIGGLMVRTLLDWDVDAMTGTMRCNRGMHHTAYGFGATPIESGIMHHGVEVDLVAFYRRRLLKPGALQPDLAVENLWKNRADLGVEKRRAA